MELFYCYLHALVPLCQFDDVLGIDGELWIAVVWKKDLQQRNV